VALLPGGRAEAGLARTNKVLLSKQLDFINLAIETKALLVPVLGIGEERIGGAGATMLMAAVLLPAKPVPLKVSLFTARHSKPLSNSSLNTAQPSVAHRASPT
jgi:hypothetical protein